MYFLTLLLFAGFHSQGSEISNPSSSCKAVFIKKRPILNIPSKEIEEILEAIKLIPAIKSYKERQPIYEKLKKELYSDKSTPLETIPTLSGLVFSRIEPAVQKEIVQLLGDISFIQDFIRPSAVQALKEVVSYHKSAFVQESAVQNLIRILRIKSSLDFKIAGFLQNTALNKNTNIILKLSIIRALIQKKQIDSNISLKALSQLKKIVLSESHFLTLKTQAINLILIIGIDFPENSSKAQNILIRIAENQKPILETWLNKTLSLTGITQPISQRLDVKLQEEAIKALEDLALVYPDKKNSIEQALREISNNDPNLKSPPLYNKALEEAF